MTEPTNADIRAWARQQGLTVADRGRVPAAVVDAYYDAQAPEDEAAAPPPAPERALIARPAPPLDPYSTSPQAQRELDRPAPPHGWQGPGSAAPHEWQAPPGSTDGSTDGFAMASLIFGLIGGPLLGVIFGIVGLRRIKRSGRPGRRLAIAGLVLSGLWTLGLIGIIAAVAAGQADRDVTGKVTASGDVALDQLQVGDCTAPLPEGESRTLPVVPCDTAHTGEVFAIFPLQATDYPGDEEVARFSEGGCEQAVTAEVEAAIGQTPYDLVYYTPTAQTWAVGDRTVICLLVAPSGQTTGSVVEGARRPS